MVMREPVFVSRWIGSVLRKAHRCGLLDDAGLPDQLDVGARAAVANGRLVGIHLDERIVHAEPRERGKDMLDGVHLHRALAERGGPLDRLHMIHVRIDRRLIGEIHAPEFAPVPGRRGVEREGHFFARVERRAGKLALRASVCCWAMAM